MHPAVNQLRINYLRGYYQSLRLSQRRHECGNDLTAILSGYCVAEWGVIHLWTLFPVSPATQTLKGVHIYF